MPRIDESVAVHKLNFNPQAKPVKQKRRTIALKKQKVINEEISKLLVVGFISIILNGLLMWYSSKAQWEVKDMCGLH